MSHKFNSKNIKKLEYLERFIEEPFDNILKLLPINKLSSIVELGCGSGFYTFPLAHYSAGNAKVYALDVEAKMLDFLRANMRGGEIVKPLHPADVKKIIPILIKENEFQVPDGNIDLFFCAKVFHEIEGFPKFFGELSRIMMKDGLVFVLDWKKEPTERGPPIEHRIDVQVAIEKFKRYKFQIENYGEIFTYYYYIIARMFATNNI
ncbi:MAG: type 11 methyltransferase [Promethearchaeota archaeon CR_4]|nr:MAG: type 11 methyltransferase [Candidatus Lokiarchaeota archaeon CR_4]